MRRNLFMLSVALAVGMNTASAQTSLPTSKTPSATEAEASKALKEDLFSVAAIEETKLLEKDLVPLSLAFKKLSTLPEDVSIEGVTAEGYTRYVIADGKKIGQAVITKLRKGDKFVDLKAENFSSQFELKQDEETIKPDKLLNVDGNEEELVKALKKLNEEGEEEPEKEEEENNEPRQDKQPDQGGNQNRGSGSASQGGGQGAGNDIAGDYSTPDRAPVKEEEKTTTEVRVTADGCDLVVDAAGNVVREQNKAQTFENGVMISEEACSDSGRTFPIQKSYLTCKDKVDLPALRAQPQYITYFNDPSGVRQELGACEPDADKVFPIVEKDSCPIDIDLTGGTAVIHSKLVYVNNTGQEVQVRDCQPSESKAPIRMTQDFAACSIKHDFKKGKSVALATWIYENDGSYFQASPCIETDSEYRHQRVFKQAGVDVCPVLLNVGGATATPQYRTQIDVDGEKLFIDECKPDTSANMAFKSTTDTCDNPANFQHDLEAGVSYGLQRYYYENPNRVYVSECQYGEPTYSHSHKQTGWKHDDDDLSSQALTTVSIRVGSTSHEIAKDIVLAGETKVQYTPKAPADVAIEGTKTNEGCNVFQQTQRMQEFTRPDGSTYQLSWGDGLAQELGDKCVRELAGWKHIDPELVSLQTTTIKVAYDDIVKVIEEGVVTEDAPEVDYIAQGSAYEVITPNQKTHQGCEVFKATESRQKYIRADESIYEATVGMGQGVPLGDHCTREAVGWEHNDEEKFSQELTTVTLAYDDVTEIINDTEVLPDAEKIAYIESPPVDAPIEDGKYHEQCNVFQKTNRTQTFKRGDETEYVEEQGEGEPLSLGDKCTRKQAGWEHNDSEKYSQKKMTVTVAYDGVSEVLNNAEVLPGSERINHASLSSQTKPMAGEKYHEQCNVFQKTRIYDRFRRPDNSEYADDKGYGQPLALGDKCSRRQVGWKHDDSNKYSQKKMTVTVAYDGFSKVLNNAEVLPGSERINHVSLTSKTTPIANEKYHQSCNVFQKTRREEKFRRPDDSEYWADKGNGDPLSLGDHCTTTIVGWQNDDSKFRATPKKKVVVKYDSVTKTLHNNKILPGTDPVPYARMADTKRTDSSTKIEGCRRYSDVFTRENWRRPDDTTLVKERKTGTHTRDSDVCIFSAGRVANGKNTRDVKIKSKELSPTWRTGSFHCDLIEYRQYEVTYEERMLGWMVNPNGEKVSTSEEAIRTFKKKELGARTGRTSTKSSREC